MLEIKKLHVSVEGTPIVKGIDLTIKPGEIHAIMGPNGAGKSTLAKVLAGHPAYEVTEGKILFQGKDVLELEPEERAALGLFMSFQYPPEIMGVSTRDFLFQSLNSVRRGRGQEELSEEKFDALLVEKLALISMSETFAKRDVNEGFSGGEKKRSEILQMAILEPTLAILDETDSGLDIDAMRIVADGVNQLMSEERSLLVITHYQRLLDYIKPTKVHVMVDGKFVHSSDASLALELEKSGYDNYIS
ncbi:MAG: putative ATP-dependent transporter SufC [Chlamydiales bacterium]|nr:putative ATP-dependent transporter SufC [Chlamydiales bacterium]MCH9619691.1 putative ATP-dependent transporter SufC [Chlamydiales bacterium]MCH9623297.1 putative ATP-dependent transporter SufC [Chlamydiales bacterium]